MNIGFVPWGSSTCQHGLGVNVLTKHHGLAHATVRKMPVVSRISAVHVTREVEFLRPNSAPPHILQTSGQVLEAQYPAKPEFPAGNLGFSIIHRDQFSLAASARSSPGEACEVDAGRLAVLASEPAHVLCLCVPWACMYDVGLESIAAHVSEHISHQHGFARLSRGLSGHVSEVAAQRQGVCASLQAPPFLSLRPANTPMVSKIVG